MKSEKDHTHPADHFEVASMKVKAEIKANVLSQHSNPSAVIAEKMCQYPVQVGCLFLKLRFAYIKFIYKFNIIINTDMDKMICIKAKCLK